MSDSEEGNVFEVVIDEEDYENCDEAEDNYFEDCYEFAVTDPDKEVAIDDFTVRY